MFDYDITVGFRRKSFGLMSNSYSHRSIISSSFRYGLNNFLTPQVLVQGGEGLALGGLGFTALAGSLGVVDIAESFSNYDDKHGHQTSVSYNYRYRKVGINASYLQRYEYYRDLGTQDGWDYLDWDMPEKADPLNGALRNAQMQVSVSYHDNWFGGFNLSMFRMVDYKDESRAVANFSWSRYFSSNVSMFFNLSKQLQGQRENFMGFTLSIPFGETGQASTFVQREANGELQSHAQAISNAPYSEGFGWGVNIEDSEDKNRYVVGDWRNKYSEISLSAYRSGNLTQYTKTLNGALVFMDRDFHATRFVTDAFALVNTEHNDVPVMIGNQLIGSTDKRGKLLVPDLSSYLENRISINPTLLPVNASVDSIEQMIVPRSKGGVHVKFPIKFLRSALVKVTTPDHQPLPAGSVLSTRPEGKNYIAGWDGEVYVENLAGPLTLYWEAGQCVVELKPARNRTTPLPRVGPFSCTPLWGDDQ